MGEEPDRIRAEIEETRAEMSETVDALGYKADVKTRAKENLQDKKESIAGTASRAGSVAQENPIGLALGSIAIGFVAGMLIPSTRVEDEKLGEVSDSVVEKAKETGQEALEHGKQVAQDVAETAKESGQQHAEEVKESAQQSAHSDRRGSAAPLGTPAA
jgi:gas vesicle protein